MNKLKRTIYTSKPITFVNSKSKKIFIPGFKGLPLYDVARFFIMQVKKVGLNERAAGISFNLIMALPAGLLFLFSVIPYLPESLDLRKQLLNLFKDLTPNSETYKFIQGLMNDLMKKHTGVFSFGFLLLMFYSSNATMGIIRTFDKSIAENKKYFLHKRWRAIKLTAILFILFIAGLLVLIGQQELAKILSKLFHTRISRLTWWKNIRWLVIITLIFYSIAFIYKFAPSIKKRWSVVSPGSLLATFLTLVTTIGFSFWVNNFGSYNKVYGSIGTVLIIMFLLFLNSLILLIGFELNVSITYLKAEAEERQQKEMSNSPITV